MIYDYAFVKKPKGSKIRIPFTNNGPQSKEFSMVEKSADLFDWTEPYIPPVGWQD